MNTFEEAVAAARAAKETIERREGSKRVTEEALEEARKDFAETKARLLENLEADTKAIETARLELQAALQRQNDAPLQTAEAKAASAFAALETAAPAEDEAKAIDPLPQMAREAAARFSDEH